MTKKQTQFANMEDLMPVILERLAAGQNVQFSPRGRSMLPMLREGRDSVILSKLTETPKPYDVILYQRADGKYVLHRIVALDRRGGFVCMGDHQLAKEYGIRPEHVIGVVNGFCRGGRQYDVSNKGYRLYCHFWYQARRGVRLMRRITGRLRRK